jgi:urate oxidase
MTELKKEFKFIKRNTYFSLDQFDQLPEILVRVIQAYQDWNFELESDDDQENLED